VEKHQAKIFWKHLNQNHFRSTSNKNLKHIKEKHFGNTSSKNILEKPQAQNNLENFKQNHFRITSSKNILETLQVKILEALKINVETQVSKLIILKF